MSVLELRNDLAVALADALKADCWPFPNEQMTPPCLFITPNDNYIEPVAISNGGGSARTNLLVTVVAGLFDNESSLEVLENMAVGVYANAPKNFKVGPSTAPRQLDLANLSLLTLDIPVQATFTF